MSKMGKIQAMIKYRINCSRIQSKHSASKKRTWDLLTSNEKIFDAAIHDEYSTLYD